MKEYTIVKKQQAENFWDSVPKLNVDTFWWVDNDYQPETTAQICYDEKNIYVKFITAETEVTAKYTKMHEDVYKDSCVEFFLRPVCDKRYFNFEINCIGNILLGIGPEDEGREAVQVDPSIFEITPSIKDAKAFNGPYWTMEYKIPFSFLKEYWGEFDIAEGLFANCYKCGDETKYEHYGMWSPCLKDDPNFHRPQCFGRMYFEL